ncbi:MAG: CoA transferase [Chloroflexota bacterium]|nr:CoA transferase [Chloroflexota bacterium]
MGKLPLEGVRVVDFTQIQAGPQATIWLAALGAEVIKIESNKRPDMLRTYFQLQTSSDDPSLNKSTHFAFLNYSKKGCTLNLTNPRAIEIAKELVKVSDVVAENFSVGVMERLGLDYATLQAIKPDLIMLSISGFGNTGPDKDHVAYAAMIHAFSGLASLTGYIGGDPTPSMGPFWSDKIAAQTGAFAVMVALHHRAMTGEGQYLDLSMSEATLAVLPEAVMDYTMNQIIREPKGNREDFMAPCGCYHCQGEDEWVAIAVANDEEWNALCGAMGNPEWAREERFSDQISRCRNQDALDVFIQEWTVNRGAYEVMEILQKAGVAAGPSVNVEQLANDPHLKERGFFVEMDHPEMGKGLLPRVPGKPIPTPIGNFHPAPSIGQHNDYVLRELLGIPEDEIARLVEDGAIY